VLLDIHGDLLGDQIVDDAVALGVLDEHCHLAVRDLGFEADFEFDGASPPHSQASDLVVIVPAGSDGDREISSGPPFGHPHASH